MEVPSAASMIWKLRLCKGTIWAPESICLHPKLTTPTLWVIWFTHLLASGKACSPLLRYQALKRLCTCVNRFAPKLWMNSASRTKLMKAKSSKKAIQMLLIVPKLWYCRRTCIHLAISRHKMNPWGTPTSLVQSSFSAWGRPIQKRQMTHTSLSATKRLRGS